MVKILHRDFICLFEQSIRRESVFHVWFLSIPGGIVKQVYQIILIHRTVSKLANLLLASALSKKINCECWHAISREFAKNFG